jgi:ferredoxin
MCSIICPDVFTMTDHGYTVALPTEVPPQFEDDVREAAHVCPERAITTN